MNRPAIEEGRPAPRGKRIEGVDLARAIAIIGMLAVHIGPENVPGFGGRLYALGHGRASVLFVVVAGIGISLLAARGDARAPAKLLWMALLLLPLGLVLQKLDHPVAVILHHYSAFFVLGLCLLRLSNRGLLGFAAMLTLLGPLLYLSGRMLEPGLFARQVVSISSRPTTILAGLLVSGPYPLLTWGVPLAWGMWIGRHDLRARRTRLALCVGGGVVAVMAVLASGLLRDYFGSPRGNAEWRFLLVDTAHSQMPLWLATSTGSAALALGTALIVADRWPTLLHPLVAFGQMALTMYVAHLLVLHWWGSRVTHDDVLPAVITISLLTAAGAVFAVAWQRFMPRGPIETLIQLPFQSRRPISDRPHKDPAGRPAPEQASTRTLPWMK